MAVVRRWGAAVALTPGNETSRVSRWSKKEAAWAKPWCISTYLLAGCACASIPPPVAPMRWLLCTATAPANSPTTAQRGQMPALAVISPRAHQCYYSLVVVVLLVVVPPLAGSVTVLLWLSELPPIPSL
jgi:hypothetical protein